MTFCIKSDQPEHDQKNAFYRSISYFSRKWLKYVVGEHFTDMFSIFAAFQVH